MASAYKPKGRLTCRIKFKDQSGRYVTAATGFRDKRNARSLAEKVEADAGRLRAGLHPQHPEITGPFLGLTPRTTRGWEEAVEAYLAELQRLGSPADGDHVRDSHTLLKRIQADTAWQALPDIQADAFTTFLGELAKAGRAPRTQNRYYETLRAACNFWVRQGWLAANPIASVEPARVGQAGRRRRRRAYTLLELDRLCAAARDTAALCYRVAAYSGFRRGELRRLRREDCTPTGPKPRWHVDASRTKNKQPVHLPMTPECAAALAPHWSSLPAGAPLLRVPRKETFVRHRLKAGIPAQDERGRWADFHSLRYTFCALLSAVYPIEVVSKLMRHCSLNLTTQVYLDLGLDRQGEDAWILQPLRPQGADRERRKAS